MIYFTLFFDNAGGITLFCSDYSHLYSDPHHAARDVAHLITNGDDDLGLWDGNENLNINDYHESWARHGDLSWAEQDDVQDILNNPEAIGSAAGLAEQDFYQHLTTTLEDTTHA